jgi:aldose 1-epimerase
MNLASRSMQLALLGFLVIMVVAPRAGRAFPPAARKARVQKSVFGKLPDGSTVDLYTLTNSHGAMAKVMTFGATLTQLWMPDRNGKMADVVLGFDNLADYLKRNTFFGATVGRYANCIANASFTLDGKTYTLSKNDGRVTFALMNNNALEISYVATTDKDTPVNFTNHSYFNLSGAGNGNVLKDVLWLNADRYTPFNAQKIPTGKIASVAGTPYDFRKPTEIGARIAATPGGAGYDMNFVLNGKPGQMRKIAELRDPASGRTMAVSTDQPGVQLYTPPFKGGMRGFGGTYQKFGAVCFETQHFPDSVHQPNFPSVILRPGKVFRTETIFQFSTN